MFLHQNSPKIRELPEAKQANKQRLAQEKHHIQDNLGSKYQMMKDYLVFF